MVPLEKPGQAKVTGFIGVGLDGKDGHKRITQSEYFLLVGGSEETHGYMQDTAIRFGEAMKKKGKRLEDASVKETIEMLYDASKS